MGITTSIVRTQADSCSGKWNVSGSDDQRFRWNQRCCSWPELVSEMTGHQCIRLGNAEKSFPSSTNSGQDQFYYAPLYGVIAHLA